MEVAEKVPLLTAERDNNRDRFLHQGVPGLFDTETLSIELDKDGRAPLT